MFSNRPTWMMHLLACAIAAIGLLAILSMALGPS